MATVTEDFHLDKILNRPGPLAHPNFEAGEATKDFLHNTCRVLVVGAGGLGCEILKDLSLSGFRKIDVIDMDTIDVSNLNRQFLFRAGDVGKSKSEVAANFINTRRPEVKVTPHHGKIQDKDEDFYRQFNIIILGLDSVEARWWMNAMVCGLLSYDEDGDADPSTIIPMVDGGTEGFKGHSRVILPGFTACFECTIDLFPPQTKFPLCTLAETPRTAAHCIEWAHLIKWDLDRKEITLDADNPDHIQWLYDQAKMRADMFGIQGVTYSHTQGVIKNIIPAIASTNAIVAAECVNEALKLSTQCHTFLQNYMMYMGGEGVYTHTFEAEKKDMCFICSNKPIYITVAKDCTVQQFIDTITSEEYAQYKLINPNLTNQNSKGVFYSQPEFLRQQTVANLTKPLTEYIQEEEAMHVTDTNLPRVCILRFVVRYAN
eukprot:GFYU01001329.1.p1 GENE.GFYU01001329.1~~GFYU01001329.1.p1  ORF type:complete len:451 (-),score=149.89 GFYU01001329.1:158-1450(-)